MVSKVKKHFVTYEQAKLLFEKNFNIPCNSFYLYDKGISEKGFCKKKVPTANYNTRDKLSKPFYKLGYSRPEIHTVIEWIRIKHKIWIEIRHIKVYGENKFYIIIYQYGKDDYYTIHCKNDVGYKVWNTPQKATIKAIDYVLEKLI